MWPAARGPRLLGAKIARSPPIPNMSECRRCTMLSHCWRHRILVIDYLSYRGWHSTNRSAGRRSPLPTQSSVMTTRSAPPRVPGTFRAKHRNPQRALRSPTVHVDRATPAILSRCRCSLRSAMPRSPSPGRISGPSTVMTLVGRWAYLPLPHPHAAGAPRMTVLSGYSWRNDRAHSAFCETMCGNAKSA